MIATVSPALKPQPRDEVLGEAVQKYRGRLTAFIGQQLRDRAEAEDVYQEVFEEFARAYDLGQAIETLGAWLVRVAQNKILDRFRRRKTRADYELLIQSESGGVEPTAESRPDEEWTRGLLRAGLVAAIERLPREQREVFVKHELEGMSFEQIAAQTKVGVNTLLSRKRYAVLALRESLKEMHDELA